MQRDHPRRILRGGEIFARTGGDQQWVPRKHLSENTRPTVIPGGDPLGGVTATHQANLHIRAENVYRLPRNFQIKPALGSGHGKAGLRLSQGLQHGETGAEIGAIQGLMGKNARQNQNHFSGPTQRRTRDGKMRYRRRVPRAGKHGYTGRRRGL